MLIQEIQKMPAGRKLDAMIAEKLENWKWITLQKTDVKARSYLVHPVLHDYLKTQTGWLDDKTGEEDLNCTTYPTFIPCPNYSTDWGAVGIGLEKLLEKKDYLIKLNIWKKNYYVGTVQDGIYDLQFIGKTGPTTLSKCILYCLEKEGK